MVRVSLARERHFVVLALTLELLLISSCSSDRPTEIEEPQRAPNASAGALCSDCMIDNFTDVNGRPLENHVPDGGTTAFSWTRVSPQAGATIQDNAVASALPGNFWQYLTSTTAGDWVELTVDVFSDPAADSLLHDIVILLRHSTSGQGYRVFWEICGTTAAQCSGGLPAQGHGVVFLGPSGESAFYQVSLNTVSPGMHTFRAEIVNNSSTVQVSIDGAVVATHMYSTVLPPDRAGIGFNWGSVYAAYTQHQIRITSFSAATPPCPPSGDSVLDSRAVRDGLKAGLAASGPNLPFLQRNEHGGIIYQDTITGSYIVSDIPTALSGPRVTCAYLFPNPLPPGPPNGKQIAIWHTHPHVPSDTAYNCNPQDPVNSAVPYAVDPRPNGGGSPGDWNTTNVFAFPGYIISKLNEIVRLDTGVVIAQRKQNTNRWSIGNDSRACLTRSSLYVGL